MRKFIIAMILGLFVVASAIAAAFPFRINTAWFHYDRTGQQLLSTQVEVQRLNNSQKVPGLADSSCFDFTGVVVSSSRTPIAWSSPSPQASGLADVVVADSAVSCTVVVDSSNGLQLSEPYSFQVRRHRQF